MGRCLAITGTWYRYIRRHNAIHVVAKTLATMMMLMVTAQQQQQQRPRRQLQQQQKQRRRVSMAETVVHQQQQQQWREGRGGSYHVAGAWYCLLMAVLVRPSNAWLTTWGISHTIPVATTTASSLLAMSTSSVPDLLLLGSTTTQHDNHDQVRVDLANGRDYPIYIGTAFDPAQAAKILQSHLAGKKVLLITNDRVAPLYLEQYQTLLSMGDDDDGAHEVHTLVVPDGEAHKSMTTLHLILDRCLELQLDRAATLVALGGGVMGDLVGFAAAIYVRGIAFVQVPTTVMAMVDSSVGGKTGVNHRLGKNMIGAFYQPQCVYIDIATLSTLPNRELCSGLAEMIKYGLIRDAPFFEWLETNMPNLLARDQDAWRYAITRSCQNKAAVVKADEMESSGVRATLNLGHTFGHAIENGSGYGHYLHGEAVAIGMAMAASMSYKLGWIDATLWQRVAAMLRAAQLPTQLPADSPMTRATFLQLMAVDKKVTNGQLRLILLQGDLGHCVFTGNFADTALLATIDEFVAGKAGTWRPG